MGIKTYPVASFYISREDNDEVERIAAEKDIPKSRVISLLFSAGIKRYREMKGEKSENNTG